jgi:hypothetical protein
VSYSIGNAYKTGRLARRLLELENEMVSRPEKTLTIQFREFERPTKGGRMQLKESKTITLHDVLLKENPRQITRRSERGGRAEER